MSIFNRRRNGEGFVWPFGMQMSICGTVLLFILSRVSSVSGQKLSPSSIIVINVFTWTISTIIVAILMFVSVHGSWHREWRANESKPLKDLVQWKGSKSCLFFFHPTHYWDLLCHYLLSSSGLKSYRWVFDIFFMRKRMILLSSWTICNKISRKETTTSIFLYWSLG